MKHKLFTIGFLLSLQAAIASAQTPESFFPFQVGNLWEYQMIPSGELYQIAFTSDSLLPDGSHYIFYNTTVLYRIDTSADVYLYPLDTTAFNWLRYKLPADSGEVWQLQPPHTGGWAWVAEVESAYVFSQPTVVKVFRYGPGHPDSTTAYLEEDRLASGFGLIYTWREPNDIRYLRGCIIDGDTFGIITNVRKEEFVIPREYQLKQNYPNPFNPTTTIEFELPEAAVVSVRVYDLLGRQVATLVEGKLSVGTHRVMWDARELPSGIYFIRLTTLYATQIRKAMLVR